MMKRKYDFINDYFEFNKDVFIYGAGIYARYALNICKMFKANVLGFITTSYEKDELYGLPVYEVKIINENYKSINLIPGFKGCSVENLCVFEIDIYYLDIILNIDTVNDILYHKAILNIRESFNYFPVYSEAKSWKNTLIIRLDAIGDLVCTTPLIREIKENIKNGNNDVLIQAKNADVVVTNPYIDHLFVMHEKEIYSSPLTEPDILFQLITEAKEFVMSNQIKEHLDAVILPMKLLEGRNATMSLIIAVAYHPDNILAWTDENECGLWVREITKSIVNHIHIIDEPMHESQYHLEMLRREGININNKKDDIFIYKPKFTNKFILKKYINHRKIAVGIVGSDENRNWKVNRYNELFELYKDCDAIFIVLGGDDAQESAEQIIHNNNVVNLVKKTTLKETIELLNICDIYVGSNTGLMHIAAALGKPCVTLYSVMKDVSPWNGNSPHRYGVKNVPHIDLLPDQGLDDCEGYCHKNYSHCINQISVTEVSKAINCLLNIDNLHKRNNINEVNI